MRFSEFMTHLKRSTNLFNATQTTEILSTTLKKYSETDPAQQKQCKQLILTDSKNIFT